MGGWTTGSGGGDPTGGDTGGGWGEGGGLLGSIIEVGGALYDSYQNRKAARENTDKTIAANKAEAELAYQRQIEQWERMNAYNSPQAQMQRFIAAGLNPHLIYGQGSSGNASSPPSYQPPRIQYQYAAGNYGAAVSSALPTLMAVGTWLQNMRMGEVSIQAKKTEIERAQEIIDYMTESNPVKLRMMQNQESIFPYQKAAIRYGAEKANRAVLDMEQEFFHKWGKRGHANTLFGDNLGVEEYGGLRGAELKSKQLMNTAQSLRNRLLDAQSSWTDFDVTNPQALMQMVLGGVMGLAGQTMRMSTHRRSKSTSEVEEIMRTGRRKIRRRIYER